MKQGFLIVALLAPLAGCNGHAGGASPPPEAAAPAAGYFVVPQAQLPHVQVVPVSETVWQTTVHTTGTVDWDNDHTTQAITQVGGPITRIVADTGTHVAAGDPLLYVASPDVTNAVATYRKAKNRLDLAKLTLDRNKDLLAHQAISQSVLEGVQADYNDASTDLQNALQTLKIMGIAPDDLTAAEQQNVAIRPELPMRAPIAGTVVQKLVLPGQLIQAGQTEAFVISDTSTVWVQGHIYERDLPSVREGDTADIRSPAMATVFHGTVERIDSLVDPATRTTLVRIVTANTDHLLKKDMYVDVTVHDRARRNVLTVPVAAVLYDEQNFPFVYIQISPGKFAQRQVTIGAQQDEAIEIVHGLAKGDPVVAQGSLFLQFANSFGG